MSAIKYETTHVVIFHAECTDGMAAAWAARTGLVLHDGTRDAQVAFVPMRYGDPLDVDELTGMRVLIADFSFPRDVLLKLHRVAKSLRVLDHHKTAAADLAGLDFCTFDMERSGAGLVWDLLVCRESHQFPRPWLIDYVEDRDLWRFALPDSRDVCAALQELPVGRPGEPVDFAMWDNMARSDTVEEVARDGRCHRKTAERFAADIARTARDSVLGGHRCKVATSSILFSEVADLLTREHPMGAVCFQRADGRWQYSLRSRSDFDVSEVARMFGGGGHARAAGFVVDAPAHYAARPLG